MESSNTFLAIVPFCQKCGFSTVESRGKVCAKCGAQLETYQATVFRPEHLETLQPERRDP